VTPTPPETSTTPAPPDFANRPGWVKFTTVTAFVWGLALGTYESLTAARVAVLGFSGGLILLGVGLRAAASRVFTR